MTKEEAERRRESAASKKGTEKRTGFGRFSALGGNKARNHSFEDESASSKRDSKSSSGTNFSNSRPYENNRFGSTSTLPSSADAEPHDNMFANLPSRPHIPQSSSVHTFSLSGQKKVLPMLPKSKTMTPFEMGQDDTAPGASNRSRAMTSSSYASTAVAPKLDADLHFDSGFDDLFAGLDSSKRQSPELKHTNGASNGRSLLAGKRDFQAKPLDINRALEIEPPPKSWDSRGSGDRLIASPLSASPPPPPPHKYVSSLNGVAAEPVKPSSDSYEDKDARMVRESFIARKSLLHDSPEQKPTSLSSNSALSVQTPFTSRTSSHNTGSTEDSLQSTGEEDNLFSTEKKNEPAFKKPVIPEDRVPTIPPIPTTTTPTQSSSTSRVMTAAEFRAMKENEKVQPPPQEENDSEDEYEDEEEAILKREQEEIQRRKLQQQRMAREHLRKSTAVSGDPNRPASGLGAPSMGFPSEVSLKADDWSDEDVPLAILREHGFPSSAKAPTRPADAAPSFIRGASGLSERPASAGAGGGRVSTYLPPFAKRLPEDPYLGAGLVQPANRESMGFSNRGPASVHGGDGYRMPGTQVPLVAIIQQEEQSKQLRRGGGATAKDTSGAFSYQGFGSLPATAPGRVPQQGMGGTNMLGMGVGQQQMPQMPMMGMNPMMPMGYQAQPTPQDMFQLQQQMMVMQMNQMRIMQMSGMGGMGMQMPQMMGMPAPMPMPGMQRQQSNGFLDPSMQRPMSIASSQMPPQHGGFLGMGSSSLPARPTSTFGMHPPQLPNPGYTPSIAPSERSNIGMAPRYRTVATNPHDGISSESSQTLQATGGASDRTSTFGGKIKGILKKSSPTPTPAPAAAKPEPADEENWGSLAARRRKASKKENGTLEPALKDLYTDLN